MKLITAMTDTNKEDYENHLEDVLAKLPEAARNKAKKAFNFMQKGNYELAQSLCIQLLDVEDGDQYYDIRMMLGNSYFAQGDMRMAEIVFHDLVTDLPEEELPHMHLGFAYHGLGEYQLAVKEFERIYPVSSYHPFFYNAYGDSLNAVGKRAQSRDIFSKEIEQYEKTGFLPSAEMLDGTYQNVLYLDVALGNGKYPEDIQSYYKFLDSIEMDETMQEYLAGTIVRLCGLMQNKWYRPLFKQFVEHIHAKGYLAKGKCKTTLDSAYASIESYQYHEDRKINAFLESYLAASYTRVYNMEEMPYQEQQKEVMVTALTYEWYVCEYYNGHEEEFRYLESTYPYIWRIIQPFIQSVAQDAASVQENKLKELYEYRVEKVSVEDLRKSLYESYTRAVKNEKQPTYIYDGYEPYKRMQAKVGRNEPCPCGSGKKYKQCCGR